LHRRLSLRERPDGFLDNAPATLEFVEDLGLSPKLLPSRDEARRRYVFRRHELHEVPVSPGRFLTSRLLSPASKLRVLTEPLAERAPRHDESILHFAERPHRARSGAGARRLDGIGDLRGRCQPPVAARLFPKMHEMDAQYGSLVPRDAGQARTRRARPAAWARRPGA
jgi:oxygen-dependent protoporphyrinogen oxidase